MGVEENKMNNQPIGRIVGIRGQVVEVEVDGSPPKIFDILTVKQQEGNVTDNIKVILEVISFEGGGRFFCLGLSGIKSLQRGLQVINTGQQLMMPVGKKLLGRAIDIFGNVHDGKGELLIEDLQKTYEIGMQGTANIRVSTEIEETGIKAMDFFCPVLRGGKVGLFGGAGVGKTILLTELINNLVVARKESITDDEHYKLSGQKFAKHEVVAVFSAVGERSREAQELYSKLTETKAIDKMALVLGQMGENPAVRSRTAFAGAALAGYFRDEFKSDVLFLIDNVYRFAQAGHELSMMMNTIPSEDGYQPTMDSEMGRLHERLLSTEDGFVTAIEAIFVPSDDMTDYGVRSIFPFLDTFVILSRDVYQEGRLPAIDILASTSRALNKEIVGKSHYEAYLEAKRVLEQADNLENIVSLVGFSELSFEDQTLYKRATLLKNYMTQPFFTTTEQTGKEGSYVSLSNTIKDVVDIIKGKYDILHPEKLKYIGEIKEVV